jgi:dephospho-CoA kinase
VTTIKHSTFIVALTGGIASGKTAVSDRFAALGVPVIDTDVIAHQVVAVGQPALQEIRDVFGAEVLLADGNLDRKALRQIVFSDPVARKKLEDITHPAIRARVLRDIAAVETVYCVVVIPLFTETGAYDWVDRVLVVDSSEATQLERVMQRDGVSREQAEAALASQTSRQARLALADDVIENNGELAELDAAVQRLHGLYLKLASAEG